MTEHADMTGSLTYHEIELDPVCHIIGFDEALSTMRKPQLSINDIASIINDSNPDFIDTMLTLMAKTAIMIDDSWFGGDDDMDDNMDDGIYHYDGYDDMVYHIPTAKIIPQSVDWPPTSVVHASSISPATKQRFIQVLFDSGGTKTMIHHGYCPRIVKSNPFQPVLR